MRVDASGPRLYLFQMVLAVVVLDAVAIAVYRFAGIRAAGSDTRLVFTVVWTVATALVVGLGLRRIRRARTGSPRAARR
jgi:carbon starvation protein CstA